MYQQGYQPSKQGSASQTTNWYAPPPQPKSRGGASSRARGGSGGGGAGQKPAGRSFKSFLIKTLIVLVLLAAAGAGAYVWKVQSDVRPYANVFLDNISVDGIALGGKTWAEGSDAVWAQANAKQNSWYVRLRNNAGEYADITAQTLGISFDPSAALEQAWAVGHSADASGRVDIFSMQKEIEHARTEPHEYYSAQQTGDLSTVDGILDTLEKAAYKTPSDARILSFNPDDTSNPFIFQSEVYGQWLDTAAIRAQITEMVNTLQSGEILIEPTPIAPGVTVSDLQKTVELRCRATTPIARDSTEGRTNNIRIAFGKINGMVIKDGGKFSFNSTVGRRNEKNGFFQAIEYAYGLEVLGWGGGVCQASTTVYIAAIQSGMTISKRSAHSNPVSYTDMGKDATVSDTKGREVDFVFRNNSGAPIYISAHVIQSGTSSKSLLCEVRIYGQSLGNTRYELETEVVSTIPKPEEPTLVVDETGEHATFSDEKKLMSRGREGYIVDAYLCTITDNVQVERKKVSTDTYSERADRYWVGMYDRTAY